MTLIKINVGQADYNRSKEVSIAILGFEAYVSRTRGGVWTVGLYNDWNNWSWSKTGW